MKLLRNKKVHYLGFTYLNALIQFLCIPFFANYLGSEEFGLYIYFVTFSQWLAFFSTLGTQTKVRKLILSNGTDGSLMPVRESLFLVKLLFVIAFLCLMFFLNYYEGSLVELESLVLLLFGYTLSYIAFSIFNSILLANNKVVLSSILTFCYLSIPLIISIFLFSLGKFELSWEIRVYGLILMSIVILILFRRYFSFYYSGKPFVFDYKSVYRSFKDSLIIGSYSFYDKVISLGDKLLVGYLFGIKVLAIYALGFQVSNVIFISAKAFSVFIENKILKNKKNIMSEIAYMFIFLFLLSICMLFVLNTFFDYFFNDDFYGVLDILYIQLGVVIVRVFSSIVFTQAYALLKHKVVILNSYIVLIIFSILLCTIEVVNIQEFVSLLFASFFLGLICNTYYVIKK